MCERGIVLGEVFAAEMIPMGGAGIEVETMDDVVMVEQCFRGSPVIGTFGFAAFGENEHSGVSFVAVYRELSTLG